MSDSADELYLYASNEGRLYERRVKPTYRALVARIAKGTYTTAGAVKAFESVAAEAARMYKREIPNSDYTFSAADKRACAKAFVDYFEAEFKLGNMKHL